MSYTIYVMRLRDYLSVLLMSLLILIFTDGEVKSQAVIMHASLDEPIFHLAWSPDGKLLAVATMSGIRIFDDQLLERQVLTEHLNIAAVRVSWTTDGTQLASAGYSDPSPIIWKRDLESDQLTIAQVVPPNRTYDNVHSVAWSHDATQLAVMYTYQPQGLNGFLGKVKIFVTKMWTGTQVFEEFWLFPQQTLEWNPQDTLIALSYNTCNSIDSIGLCGNPTVIVSNIETGQESWRIEDLAPTYDIKWSPDGTLIAFGNMQSHIFSADGTLNISTWDFDGENIVSRIYLDWACNGDYLISINLDGHVNIRDTVNDVTVMDFTTVKFPERILGMDVHPSDTMIGHRYR